MKKLIVANWKMNPTSEKEAVDLFERIENGIKGVKNAEVVVCPPDVFLKSLKGLTLGAQNMFYKEAGAFTGEVSPLMLKDLGVEYVIVGHSEARKHLNETDAIVNKKIKEALEVGLNPILCIGETENQKETLRPGSGQVKWQVLESQLSQDLEGVTVKDIKKVAIAYEPIWAIGTGQHCSPEEAQSSVLFIKKILAGKYGRDVANQVNILYGGSVDSTHALSYISEAKCDGLLVGGASLDPEEFIAIVKAVASTD